MNPEAAVAPVAAWTTAWPAAVAALGLLAALLLCARRWRASRRWLLAAAAVVLAGLVVRLGWLPALQAHSYDGHEADYLDLFLGRRSPDRGGTVLYPAMQWGYWLAGKVLPGSRGPVLMAAAASMVSIGAAAGVAGRLFGRGAAGWTALLLVLYGNHAFWSSSAYNVMIPLALSLVCLWGVVRATQDGALRFSLLAACAGALAVGTRLEVAVVGLPVLILLLARPPRPLLAHLGLLAGGAVFAALTAWPLVYPGGLPGEGERLFMWPMNLGLLDYLAPWGGLWVLPLVVIALLPAPPARHRVRARGLDRRAVLALLAWALVTHVVMASFDDYGYRHALSAGVALAMLCGGVLASWRRGPAVVLAAVLVLVEVADTAEVARRYYASEEAFLDTLPSNVERLPVAERPDCTVISEDRRVVGEEQLSHFNLLDPEESARLRDQAGCLQWCLDLQDWRWSSRSVRDRALRLAHLYPLEPLAVLTDDESGYACLLVELGARRGTLRSWLAPVRW